MACATTLHGLRVLPHCLRGFALRMVYPEEGNVNAGKEHTSAKADLSKAQATVKAVTKTCLVDGKAYRVSLAVGLVELEGGEEFKLKEGGEALRGPAARFAAFDEPATCLQRVLDNPVMAEGKYAIPGREGQLLFDHHFWDRANHVYSCTRRGDKKTSSASDQTKASKPTSAGWKTGRRRRAARR
eukprot:gene2445-1384_t